jgi:hypothetical protein
MILRTTTNSKYDSIDDDDNNNNKGLRNYDNTVLRIFTAVRIDIMVLWFTTRYENLLVPLRGFHDNLGMRS